MNPIVDQETAIADTVRWLERAVIGLNLCPFARAVQARAQIHFAASVARTPDGLLEDLVSEMNALHAAPPEERETTLLIAPACFEKDFLGFNDFLDDADAALESLGLLGVLQVASFHPRYRFAGTHEDDIENATNRAPYPTLHLLREAGIERALRNFENPDSIYEANIETLRRLGAAGWAALELGPRAKKGGR